MTAEQEAYQESDRTARALTVEWCLTGRDGTRRDRAGSDAVECSISIGAIGMRGRDKAVQGYVEYGTCLRCEMLCSTVHSGTVQCSTVRCSAADYSTVQCSTALSTAALQWTLSGEPHRTIRPPPPSRIGRETLPDTALRCTMLYLTHLLTGLDWS